MPTTRKRLPAIEGLRGLAACYVFLVHMQSTIHPGDWVGRSLAELLHTFTNLGSRTFLLITGCVIYRSLCKTPIPISEFWWKRISRIYLPFLPMLFLYVGFSLAFWDLSKFATTSLPWWEVVLANVFMVQAATGHPSIMIQSWTLFYILMFYLLSPLLVHAFRSLALDPYQRLFSLLFAAIALRIVDGGWSSSAFLFAGMAIGEFLNRSVALPRSTQFLILAASAGFFAFHEPLAAVSCLVIVVSSSESLLMPVLDVPLTKWIAARSYSLYLTHGLVIFGIRQLMNHLLPKDVVNASVTYWVTIPLGFSAALCVAWMYNAYVEKPLVLAAHSVVTQWRTQATQFAFARRRIAD